VRYMFFISLTAVLVYGLNIVVTNLAQSNLAAASLVDIKKIEGTLDGFIEFSSNDDNIGASTYSIGDLDFSLKGMLRIFPNAVNVSFYRPYLWEVKSFLMIPNMLESLVLMLLSLYTITKYRMKVLKVIFSNDFLTFSILFAIFFGFIVGVMSFNFGTLVRYKIPCMPFIGLVVFGVYMKLQASSRRIKSDAAIS
jgi:hypothetical protein